MAKIRLSIFVLLCASLSAAVADTVNLTKSGKYFTAAGGWSSGKAPEPGNDYIVANGLYLHGDNSQGFAGDSLQFGIVGGSEGEFFKEHTGTHTFTRLILANGFYRTWMSSDGQAAHIAGAVEVASPESAPFRLHSTHNSGRGWWLTYWDAAITGAEGTGLRVGPYPLNNAHLSKGETIFTGDNSGYLGSITVYGTNAVFAFTTGNSLGGALSSFKADAFTFCDGTTVESRGDDMTLSSSLNRGVTVDEAGGRLHVGGGKALRLEWPVTGTGPLYKVGNGKLTLAGAMSLTASDPAAACLTVSNGCLGFASGFVNNGGVISVLPEGEVTVAAGDEVTVRNLVLDGAIRISYDESMATSGVLVIDSSCTLSWPIPVYTPNVRQVKVPFLKVPTSVKTVTANDFARPDDFAATDLPSAKFTVETANGIQTVYAEMSKQVTVASSSSIAYIYATDALKWSDSRTMHSGADYLIGAGKTLSSWGLTGDCIVSGDSVTFSGAYSETGSSKAKWELGNSNVSKITGDIRTGNYVQMNPTTASGAELHLDGRLYVGSTQSSDSGLDFRASGNGITTVIDSVVSGSGYFCFQAGANNRTNTYCFTSDNNTFNGTYFLYGGKTSSHIILKFASIGSWGKNPATFRAQSVLLQSSSGNMTVELYPVGSQVMAQPNREFTFYGVGARVRVDPGEEFTLQSPAKFRQGSNSYKVGGGTWAFGGSVSIVSIASGETPILTVSEGFLRADNPRAFQDISVSVSEGAGIAAKYRPGETSEVATYGMIVTNATRFAVSGSTLKFKVATGGEKVRTSERVAVLTVPTDTSAVIDAKVVRVEHDDAYGRHVELTRDPVSIDGVSYIRYSAKFFNGLKVVFR